MKLHVVENISGKSSLLVLGLWEDDLLFYRGFSEELNSEIQGCVKSMRCVFHFGDSLVTKVTGKPYTKVMVMGMGKKQDFTLERVRKMMGKIVKSARGLKLFTLEMTIVEMLRGLFSDEELGRAAAEGCELANYDFVKYLSTEKKEKKRLVEEISFGWHGKSSVALERGIGQGKIIASATNFTKDLVNEPASVATPSFVEKVAREVAKNKKLSLSVLNKEELERQGFGAMVGVSRGSAQPPKLLVLKYEPVKSGKCTALVGKGITFDSGGYNLKPTGGIEDMKSDMSGAAAVLATLRACAELGIQRNVIGVMPLCENMIGGCAQKPGDIVKAFNGKTIEIRNTDAEGRLILADALSYTEARYKPEVMVDIATLTGACVIALGYYASGLVSKDINLISGLTIAGQKSGDRVWALPFYEEYQDAMDGTISDLRNMSSKGKGYEAGAIHGGVFLSKFVDKVKWAHIDIAGPAFLMEESDYLQRGGTGAGVRVLTYWLMGM